MSQNQITEILIQKGKQLFERPREFVEFTKDRQADELLNDLEHHPHAFVLACVMDRQIRAEKAWIIPHKCREKLGDFSFPLLAALTVKEIRELMTIPEPLHRYPDVMSENFYEAVKLIATKYRGDAAKIWHDKPSSAEVVCRFLEFRGVGPKISTMAANVLAREFKVPLYDYNCIDISVDVHVKRVFSRLGLINKSDSNESIAYRARGLYPDFPGMLDLPTWEIGRTWCHSKGPQCGNCYLNSVCPKYGIQLNKEHP